MLHFRSFIITGLMACAAILLPHQAFAEKSNTSDKPLPQAGVVHAQNQAVNKQKPETVIKPAVVNKTVPAQAAVRKAASVPQNAAPQAKAKGLQVPASKSQKAVTAPGLNKKTAVQEKTFAKPNQAVVKPVVSNDVQPKIEPKKLTVRAVTESEPVNVPVVSLAPVVKKPLKKETPPIKQEELPKINQMMNQTQRSNSSGGDSNDRVTHGSGTITGIDKWLEWDIYQQSQLVQLYVSRTNFIQNQWTNAPPSPPPQGKLFFINVTRR